MSKRTISLSIGSISLAQLDGSVVKNALLCHTGDFEGKYGPISINEQFLNALADRYNKQRAVVQNQNDYAPILKDHDRKVDNILGRLLSGLSVADWTDPETGVVEKGLYGPLRVDDDLGKVKVEKGLYSQVSLTFDEETFEIYEVSFVAVEAARRSQALSHGGNETMSVELQKQLTSLQKKHGGFKKKVSLAIKTRKEVSLALKGQIENVDSLIASLSSKKTEVELALRTVSLTSAFRGLIREGKVTKAEFDGFKITELASMPQPSLVVLMKSYSDRKPSSDVQQHGSAGSAAVAVTELSAKQFKAARDAQKKGLKSLAAEDGGASSPAAGGSSERQSTGEAPMADVKMEDFDNALNALNSIGPMMAKLTEYKAKMSEALTKLDSSDGATDSGDSEDDEDTE